MSPLWEVASWRILSFLSRVSTCGSELRPRVVGILPLFGVITEFPAPFDVGAVPWMFAFRDEQAGEDFGVRGLRSVNVHAEV